jgi:hypothetical protein
MADKFLFTNAVFIKKEYFYGKKNDIRKQNNEERYHGNDTWVCVRIYCSKIAAGEFVSCSEWTVAVNVPNFYTNSVGPVTFH